MQTATFTGNPVPRVGRVMLKDGRSVLFAEDAREWERCILAVQKVAGELHFRDSDERIRLIGVALGPEVKLTFALGNRGRIAIQVPADWYLVEMPASVLRLRLKEVLEAEYARAEREHLLLAA